MSEETAPPANGMDRATAFGWLSVLSGALSILLIVATLQPAPKSAAGQLAYFAGHQGKVALEACTVLTWAVFSIPLVVALGQILRPKSPSFARAATVLTAAGILMLGFAIFAHVGALLSIVTAGGPANAADAVYQAAIWGSLSFYITDPGLMAMGLGQILFGWLAWRSRVLPDWTSVVGTIGGIAGLLTLAVYQTSTLALVQLAAFGTWGIAAGVTLLRGRAG